MLLFKRKFIEWIRSGRKRQTVRLWGHARVRAGQRAYVPGLGYVSVTHVDIIDCLSDLTRADAVADGFGSRRELLEEIGRLYAGVGRGRKVFRIKFEWPAGETRKPGAASRKKLPAKRGSVQARREALRRYVVERGGGN